MATIGVAVSAVSNRTSSGLNGVVSFLDAPPLLSDSVTSAGTSAQSTLVIPANDSASMFWTITAADGAVWAAFGADPTAEAGVHYLIPSGATAVFSARAGDKVAIIDA